MQSISRCRSSHCSFNPPVDHVVHHIHLHIPNAKKPTPNPPKEARGGQKIQTEPVLEKGGALLIQDGKEIKQKGHDGEMDGERH